MVTGPQVERLRRAIQGADSDNVGETAYDWRRSRSILVSISRYLDNSSQQMREAIGGQTGPAVDEAFKRTAEGMRARADVLEKGAGALESAGAQIDSARKVSAGFKDLDQPTPFRAPLGNPTDDEIHQQAQSKAREKKYASDMADQEEKARIAADQLDAEFEKSTQVMMAIHGERPIDDKSDDGDGDGSDGGNGGHAPGKPAHSIPTVSIGGGGHNPGGGNVGHPGIGDPGGSTVGPTPHNPHPGVTGGPTPGPGSTHQPPFSGLNPIGGGTSTPGGTTAGTGLGVAGATAGGLGAGLLGGSLSGIRGGGVSPVAGMTGTGAGTAQNAVRGIGTTSRTPGAGTIGRSGGASAGSASASSARGAAGSGVAGRSAAGAGRSTGAGARSGAAGAGRAAAGRGGAGGRGAGSGRAGGAGSAAGGRGGRGKDDEKGRKRDLFDVAEDWVDDEDAAPGVLS